jgi:beta-glucanase (GH16 family)
MAALASASALVAMAAPALAQTPAGWTPAWSDEFNGTAVDTVRWNVLTRQNSFNNEKQYYTPNAVTVSGGELKIKATNVPLGNKQYQSGLIRTKTQQQYGRYEVRASLPTTQGMWPAIWLLPPDSVGWPTGGEIDIMENKGSQPTVIGHAYHYGASVEAHDYVSSNFSYAVNGTPVSFHNSMHTYAVEWDPSRIRYLVDNVPSYTIYKGNTKPDAPISTTPMDMIINLAVGGDYGGDPNGSTVFPQTMAVDWVHSFDRDNTTRALNNPSFEARSGALFQEWNEYSNGGGNVLPDSVAANAHSGTTAAQLYGQFNGSSDNTSGLYQEMPAVPGEVWEVGAFAQNRPGDKLAGNNTARIKIEFIDQAGNVVGGTNLLDVVNAASPANYREAILRRTAPANTKFARAVLEMRQLNNAGGAVNFDDASLRRWTASSVAGDVNLDGVRDAADLDAINHSLGAVNIAFDYTADAAVNAADVDSLLASAFGTKRGDANLDQAVSFNDLVTLAQNYDTLGAGRWAIGDFNGDSNVDFGDLVLLAQNYGFGSAGITTTDDFTADWALAQSLVPEPTTMSAAAAAAGAAAARRRRD